MLFRDAIQMLESIQAHTKETGHRVLSADDPGMSRVGFHCEDCNPFENDRTSIHWCCVIETVKRIPSDYLCRSKFLSQTSRTLLAKELTSGTCSLEQLVVKRVSRYHRKPVI